ncbi:MAG: tetratricopeptide repeat protein, partial [Calditrichaceae bacterium]
MKIVRFSLIMILTGLFILSCSSKLPEAEYYSLATDAFNKQEFQKSIENFKNIVDNYPKGQRASEALFMLGYINANHTKVLKEAEKYYKLFIEKYPNDELTDDAEYELKNLGKDINDLPIF